MTGRLEYDGHFYYEARIINDFPRRKRRPWRVHLIRHFGNQYRGGWLSSHVDRRSPWFKDEDRATAWGRDCLDAIHARANEHHEGTPIR